MLRHNAFLVIRYDVFHDEQFGAVLRASGQQVRNTQLGYGSDAANDGVAAEEGQQESGSLPRAEPREHRRKVLRADVEMLAHAAP
jgi:hypothetical protein